MKLTTKVATALIAISLCLSSCDKTGNPVIVDPTNSTTMYTMKEGNYWIYSWFTRDSSDVQSAPVSFDSTFITGKSTWQGKDAYATTKMEGTTDGNFNKQLMTYYASFTDDQYLISGAFLKALLTNIPEAISKQLNFDLPTEKWYTLADNKKDTIALLDKPIEAKGISVPNYSNVKLDLSFNILSIRKANLTEKDPMNKTKDVKAVKFELKSRINVIVNVENVSVPLANTNLDLNTYLTFAENIGLMKLNSPTQDLKFSFNLIAQNVDLYKYKILGRGFELLRYKK